jgi:predicted RND superfamily exporter protein
MSSYLTARNEGQEHAAAMRSCFKHVAIACLLTTIANVVAVLALSFTPVIPIQVFAFLCALGVALPFFFSIYLLPVMLDLWAPKAARPASQRRYFARLIPDFSRILAGALARVLPAVEKRPVAVIVLFMAVFGACIYGATQTRVDTDSVGSFPKDSKIRQSVAVVDDNMMGAQSVEIYLSLGQENAFHDPFVLTAVEQLQRGIERKYGDPGHPIEADYRLQHYWPAHSRIHLDLPVWCA